jgi:hypothetical protein
MADSRYLSIYLNDHYAGSTAGVALARRMAENNAQTPWYDALKSLAASIEADRTVLGQMRDATGVSGGTLKRLAATVGERAARMKLNGEVTAYSDLSRVEECEALIGAVNTKRQLWHTLRVGVDEQPELAGFDFDALIASAEWELDLLSEFHQQATHVAFGDWGVEQLRPS